MSMTGVGNYCWIHSHCTILSWNFIGFFKLYSTNIKNSSVSGCDIAPD